MLNLPFDDLAGPVDPGGIGLTRADDLHGIANGRQRVPQFVREHCKKFVFPPVCFLHLSFGVLLLRDICQRSNPFPDIAVGFEDRNCPRQDVTVSPIGCQDSKFVFVGSSCCQGMFPYLTDALDVIGMELSHPTAAHHLFFGLARESSPGWQVLDHFAGRVGGPHHLRRSQHKRLVSLFTPAQGSPGLVQPGYGNCHDQAGARGNDHKQL